MRFPSKEFYDDSLRIASGEPHRSLQLQPSSLSLWARRGHPIKFIDVVGKQRSRTVATADSAQESKYNMEEVDKAVSVGLVCAFIQSQSRSSADSSVVCSQWTTEPLTQCLSENCRQILLLSENFRQKCKIWNWKTFILVKFRVKIEIFSTHNLLCRKFAAVCRKIATSCPPTFFNSRRRCTYSSIYRALHKLWALSSTFKLHEMLTDILILLTIHTRYIDLKYKTLPTTPQRRREISFRIYWKLELTKAD